MWKAYEIQIAGSLKRFYWNVVILTHLHIIYGCFGATMAGKELQQKPIGLQSLTYLLLNFYKKGKSMLRSYCRL